MDFQFTKDEVELLHTLLAEILGDLSMEIADTDNPSYRRELLERRQAIEAIQARLKVEP